MGGAMITDGRQYGYTHHYCLDSFILTPKLGWPKDTKVHYQWSKPSMMNFEGNSIFTNLLKTLKCHDLNLPLFYIFRSSSLERR